MLVVTFILALFFTSGLTSDGYCTRAAGIVNSTDGGVGCFSSSLSNVTNCCFRCSPNNYGNVTKCGSLYNFNFTSCTLTANQSALVSLACLGPDTVANGNNFQCFCNTGTDNSQLNNTATAAPTNAPTNDGRLLQKTMSLGSTLFLLSVVAFFV